MKLVLASQSPRRLELMKLISSDLAADGLLDTPNFTVIPSDFDESGVEETSPTALVRRLAYEKASAVRGLCNAEDIIIGCDTVVTLDGGIFGKPSGREDAVRMLSALSGRTHTVLTGVCILYGEQSLRFESASDVTFFALTPGEIESYCDTPEPYDKAGSYGIQERGSLFVEQIAGDYNNVVGMPASALYRELKKLLAKR